jgi:hypothetical protein
LLRNNQDESKEFITLMAAISATPSALSPALIYQGKSLYLQDSWLDNFKPAEHHAFFATSQKGWSNEELGL